MHNAHHSRLTPSRKIALAALATAWALDLGHGLFVLHSLSLMKITLLLLSLTLALSKNRGGVIGCAIASLVMALICAGTAATLSQRPPTSHLMATLVSLSFFLITTLAMGISVIEKPKYH